MTHRLLCLVMLCLPGGLLSCLPTQTNEHIGPAPPKEESRRTEGAVAGSSGVVWEFDLAAMSGVSTQEEIAAGDHTAVKGEVRGECQGLLRIDVLDMGAMADGDAGASKPLTTLELEQVGPFEILVPGGVTAGIGGCCDNDRDGKIMPVVDTFILPVPLGKREGGSLISLKLGPIPTPGQPPQAPPGASDKNKPKEAKAPEET